MLILLPVGVLAAFGWVSVRQDRILAEHDAAERARAIANALLPKVWNELTVERPAGQARNAFQVDGAGLLIFPPSYSPVPTPHPFTRSSLTLEQRRLWSSLQSFSAGSNDLDPAADRCRQFLDSHPPDDMAASACYAVGLRLLQAKRYGAAAALFALIPERYQSAVGESGIPLGPLARLRLLELAVEESATNPAGMPPEWKSEAFYSNLVFHPTPLTPFLLKIRAGKPKDDPPSSQAWQPVWADHQLSRQLYLAAGEAVGTARPPASPLLSFSTAEGTNPEPSAAANDVWPSARRSAAPSVLQLPRLLWLNRDWLVVRLDDPATNHWFVWHPEAEVGMRISDLVGAERQIPEYFAIGVVAAGRQLTSHAPDTRLWQHGFTYSKSGGRVTKEYSEERATEVLASAAKSEGGLELLKVNVYLTSPSALFERQQTRAFWFGSLIAVSTLAALIGLLASGNSFLKQRELSELKSNFVSSVSHELRAPIASVRLLAESLERGKITDPAKQKEYFGFIVQECRRLSSLIANVLDFSRIEQGRKQYEFEPTNLLALVNQTVALMQPYAAEKGVSLKLETSNIEHPTSNAEGETAGNLAPDAPGLTQPEGTCTLQPATCHLELNVDGKAIQQALVNLIDNAIKHSPNCETVTVGMEARNAKSESRNAQDAEPAHTLNSQPSTLNVFVKDRGPGIPTEEHEKIFERFYRRGSELRRETQGVGIGLSIVKHIVEAHGGRVRVESAVGQGSRFTIELPFNHRDTETQRLR
jgi:signal transduction histidine kinase